MADTSAIPVGGKQMPAEEFVPTTDIPPEKYDRAARAMLSPTPHTAHTAGGASGSVWEQWVSSQKNMAPARSAKSGRSARSAGASSSRLGTGRFDSRLASGSGFTHTGPEATKARVLELRDKHDKEQREVEELKEILGRTLYTGGGDYFKRAGDVATASLQKLNDGQSDSIVEQRRRRIAEEEAASVATGRPKWDSSPMKDVPPQLKGCKPVTDEPWARDMQAYEDGLASHGFKNIDTGVEGNRGYTRGARHDERGKHVSIIEADMVAYRKELGGAKKAPVSARMLRAHGLAVPKTPKSARSTGRSARSGPDSPPPVVSERAARIAAKSPTKDAAKDAAGSPAKK